MSNLIKAYAIKYDEKEKKIIDLNEKANMFQKIYVDKFSIEPIDQKEKSQDDGLVVNSAGEGTFIEGISAISVERSESILIEEKERSIQELEELHLEKKLRLEEETKNILEDAKDEVKHMLAQAEIDANALKKDILEKAKIEGYNEGKQAALLEINRIKQELVEEKQRMQNELVLKKREMEPAFIELLIAFIKKLTGYAIEAKKEIILYLVEQAFSGIDNSMSYIIRVSKEDFEIVSSKKAEFLWKLKDGVELEVIEDRLLARTQCLIETDSRVIDCSLDVQLKNLVGDLRLLAGAPYEEELLGD